MERRRLISLGSRLLMVLASPVGRANASLLTTQDRRPLAVHTVFFQFKQGTGQDRIDGMFAQIAALRKVIPGVLDVSFGQNFSSRARSYSHAVTIRFTDRPALEAFYPHAAHQKLINESIKPIVEDLLPLDYENAAPDI